MKADVKRHIRTHTGEKPFACKFCPYRCIQKVQLTGHMIKNHSIISSKNENQVSPKYSTSFFVLLKNQIHTDITFLKISGGLRMTFCLDYLQSGPIQLGTRQFGCPFCVKIMKHSRDMKRHIMTHTGEKPFSCHFCEYKCSLDFQLKNHMNKNH